MTKTTVSEHDRLRLRVQLLNSSPDAPSLCVYTWREERGFLHTYRLELDDVEVFLMAIFGGDKGVFRGSAKTVGGFVNFVK